MNETMAIRQLDECFLLTWKSTKLYLRKQSTLTRKRREMNGVPMEEMERELQARVKDSRGQRSESSTPRLEASVEGEADEKLSFGPRSPGIQVGSEDRGTCGDGRQRGYHMKTW